MEINEIEERVRTQEAELEALRQEVEVLRQGLRAASLGEPAGAGALKPAPAAAAPPMPGPVADPRPDPAVDAVTDRRTVLRRAGAMAAGAAAGGAALVAVSASPAEAAPGSFSGNPAVTAVGTGGNGVTASSDSGNAIFASCSNAGATLFATNTVGTSVLGVSAGDALSAAVAGVSTGNAVAVAAQVTKATARAHLWLSSTTAMPVPTGRTDAHQPGEIVLDQNDDLWLCTGGGTPGRWQRLGGAATAGALTVLATPKRVYDSRPGFAPAVGTKSPLAGGVARTVDLKANGSGVPAGATAVLVSLTATGTTGAAGGFLAVYRTASPGPAPRT